MPKRLIRIPAPIPLVHVEDGVTRDAFPFTTLVRSLLSDVRFGGAHENVRAGIRVADAFTGPDGTPLLEGAGVLVVESDWQRLREALLEPQTTFPMTPELSRRIMRAGWYEQILEATAEA